MRVGCFQIKGACILISSNEGAILSRAYTTSTRLKARVILTRLKASVILASLRIRLHWLD
jgi:hypothetical protein